MKKVGSELSLNASGRILAFVLAGLLALFALVYAVNGAQAQTPADDQYGSPTAIGVVEGVDGSSGTGVIGSHDAASAGEIEDGDGASSSATGGATGDAAGGPEGVLASVLPSTGGSSVFLVSLVALALIGTGVIVFRSRLTRG